MSKVRSVIRLYTEGVSKLSIGERTGLPRNTVKKYIRLFLASGLSLEEVEKMYVDYAGEKLKYLDPFTGEICEAEVFVAILDASQLTYVEATHSQKKEDFIRSCENALHFYGGAPKANVTHNLKSAVVKSNKYEPTLNQAFHDFVSHYTMAALPAGPYKPKHKALVEGVVKIIYRTIYGEVNKEVYSGPESLNRAIATALEAHNNRLLNGRPYSRRYLFEDTERDLLQGLPATRYEIKYRKVVTVMKKQCTE